jgi:DNA-binding transcriptional ArsR family regulator
LESRSVDTLLVVPSPDALEENRLEARLDLLISLLRIAYREPIEAEHQRVLSDPASKAILGAARRDWIDAGELKRRAGSGTQASKPTIERRIAELVDRGVLSRRGAGGHVQYRSTGLIDV